MLFKKNRQSLRGLSHQEKLKKLQKLTRVPLEKLKTNIAQSDYEEDDVSMPLSVKVQRNKQIPYQLKQKSNNKPKSIGKFFDQEKLNKTIRAMTKQLYTLEKEKQSAKKIDQSNQQGRVSVFSVQDFSFDLHIPNNINQASKNQLDNFYSCNNCNEYSTQQQQLNILTQITSTYQNTKNTILRDLENNAQKKQEPFNRQSEPIQYANFLTENCFELKPLGKRKRQSSQSHLSKRFSRSKRNSEETNEQLVEKKLKFNRSNKKTRASNHCANNQNIENIYTTKTGLLTERLSYQHIQPIETMEKGLKKRRNVGKNLFSLQANLLDEKQQRKNITSKQDNHGATNKKIRVKNQLSSLQKILENSLFTDLQNGNIENLIKNKEGVEFLKKITAHYRNSIKILRQFI